LHESDVEDYDDDVEECPSLDESSEAEDES
jgi:hypothetical protein